jgi:uncharacterized protein YjbI with pentapeptide repeats
MATKAIQKIKQEILNQFSGEVMFTAEIECATDALLSIKLGLAVQCAVKARANLAGAYLADANLADANLAGANLAGANLADAYLAGANLAGAYLAGAYLARAYLAGAYLAGANLAGANLAGANLAGAYLADANLAGAYLARANLAGAYLAGAYLADAYLAGAYLAGANLADAYLAGANLARANLAGAYLADANLADVKGAEQAIAQTRILPDGDLIGWKKCRGGVIVKLRIPEAAKRSHAFGRKCRAEYADVIEVIGADVAVSSHDGETKYAAGQRVTPDKFDEDWTNECSSGIHFFITRLEAENY